jgi:hypothetical protein
VSAAQSNPLTDRIASDNHALENPTAVIRYWTILSPIENDENQLATFPWRVGSFINFANKLILLMTNVCVPIAVYVSINVSVPFNLNAPIDVNAPIRVDVSIAVYVSVDFDSSIDICVSVDVGVFTAVVPVVIAVSVIVIAVS